MDLMTWYGDCGSIIVGASGAWPGGTWPGGDLQRLSYSNYGSRFTSHGWGEDVVTTGYGTLYNAEGVNYYYASGFSGTSSASPIVAGAAADCVGYWMMNGNPAYTLTPAMLRSVLSNTGTPQIFPPAGSIGTRPDLSGAFASLYSMGVSHEAENYSFVAMSVYPNPAAGYLTIDMFPSFETISLFDLSVYDISGRLVKNLTNSSVITEGSVEWDCRDYSGINVPDGLYTAVLKYDSGSVAVPFIILGR